MTSRRPKPQPATTSPQRERIPKATGGHPAVAHLPNQTVPETAVDAPENEPAPDDTPTTVSDAQTASEPVPSPTKPPTPVLVPFSTRIPTELRDHLEWIKFTTREPVQAHVIRALTEYADRHPRTNG